MSWSFLKVYETSDPRLGYAMSQDWIESLKIIAEQTESVLDKCELDSKARDGIEKILATTDEWIGVLEGRLDLEGNPIEKKSSEVVEAELKALLKRMPSAVDYSEYGSKEGYRDRKLFGEKS